MAYQSDLGTDPLIIDESNASRFVEQWRDEGKSFGGIDRNYKVAPFGSASKPLFEIEEIPRSKWADRIKELDETKGHPDDWRMALYVPILDQNGYGYCWMYGVVGAMMTCAAMTGQPVPHLNPFPTAFRGKQGRNQGGCGEEALRYIDQWGLVEESLWPAHEAKMSNWQRCGERRRRGPSRSSDRLEEATRSNKMQPRRRFRKRREPALKSRTRRWF